METIKDNWKIKLLSVVLAIFFWSFVIVSENPVVTTRVSSVPVTFENLDQLENSGLIMTDDRKINVDISVSGQRSNVISITPQHLRVTADFQNLDEGTHVIPLNYTTPSGVSIAEAPKEITVNIERILNKDFIVSVANEGTLPENYLLESAKTTPDKITIRGARSKLESIDKVVALLNLENLTRDATLNTEIKAFDKDGNEVEDIIYGQQFVNINATVVKQKEVSINVKLTGESPDGVKIVNHTLNRSMVLIKGPESVINSIESIDTQEIDKSIVRSNRQVPVNLTLPSDVDLVNDDLTYLVDFEVAIKTNKDINVPKENIEIEGNEDKNYTINTDEIALSIAGYPEDLENITVENIKLLVNANGRANGTVSIKPKVIIDDKEYPESDITKISNVSITIADK